MADFFSLLSIDIRWPNSLAVAGQQVSDNDIKRARELVMVYMGSLTCGYANHAEISESIEHTIE